MSSFEVMLETAPQILAPAFRPLNLRSSTNLGRRPCAASLAKARSSSSPYEGES